MKSQDFIASVALDMPEISAKWVICTTKCTTKAWAVLKCCLSIIVELPSDYVMTFGASDAFATSEYALLESKDFPRLNEVPRISKESLVISQIGFSMRYIFGPGYFHCAKNVWVFLLYPNICQNQNSHFFSMSYNSTILCEAQCNQNCHNLKKFWAQDRFVLWLNFSKN